MGPSVSKGRLVHSRHSGGAAAFTIEVGAILTISAPARTWTRNHGSYGRPSSRTRYAYSLIGVAGSWCLAFGRTGATRSVKPSRATFDRIAASMLRDQPFPWYDGSMLISIALTVSGLAPRRWSANAHTMTRSQPSGGSSPRLSAYNWNGTLYARATTWSPYGTSPGARRSATSDVEHISDGRGRLSSGGARAGGGSAAVVGEVGRADVTVEP